MAAAEVDLRRLSLRALLSLPTPVLRALAGGGVICRDGATLEPRFQFLASQAGQAKALAGLSPADARAASASGLALVAGRVEAGVRVEPVSIPGPTGVISARAYRPEAQDPRFPPLVFAHLGGGVIGSLDSAEAFCSILAFGSRCPVISVDYRLAPEHRFPAGLDDMIASFRWAREKATLFGAPPDKAAIGGDAIGGNFAAVIAQETKRLGEAQPELQLLVCPVLDVAGEARSMAVHANAFPLSRATLDWFMGCYMRPGDTPTDRRLSPLRGSDLSGLAPAVVATAGFDPLSDQGAAYARRLRGQGVAVAFASFDCLAHGFTAFTGVIPAADHACRDIARMVYDVLARRAS